MKYIGWNVSIGRITTWLKFHMARLFIGRFPVAKVPIAKLNFGLFKAQSKNNANYLPAKWLFVLQIMYKSSV